MKEGSTCPVCGMNTIEERTWLRASSDNKTIYENAKSNYKCKNCGFEYCYESNRKYEYDKNKLELVLRDEEGRIIGLGL